VFTLHASGVGSGIAIGRARIIHRPGQEIPEYSVEPGRTGREVSRLRRAFARARAALEKIRDDLPEDAPEEVASFLGIHLMILEDRTMLEHPAAIIRERRINAEAALERHAGGLDKFFREIRDPYLSSKSADVAQVIQRIQGELLEEAGAQNQSGESSPPGGGAAAGEIIVANDLTPADAVELKRRRISAFITNLGGPISHTAILARSMRIPAIVGMRGATRYLRSGDLLVIDGRRGVVLVGPDARALAAYERRREKILRRIQELDSLREAEAVTLDGEEVSLLVNIELPDEAAECAAQNAHGVGLYRTEFLFMNRESMPGEDEQFEAYAGVVARARRPVTIRTLDLGADKQVDGGRAGGAMAVNPALGRRAIRLCLHDVGLFKPQLRAIYRASALGPVRIMVPMMSSMEELNQLFALLGEVRRELARDGYDFNPDAPVGGMIEVPAAAIAADLFARRLDFLSIGTNDLIQYTLAIDRIDNEVNYLYDPLHPSVLRLIKNTIDAGKSAGIPVSMCGEMAGDSAYTRILLGMGLREFSMDPASLPEVKRQIRMSDVAKLGSPVAKMLRTGEPEHLRQMVVDINR